MNHIKTLGFLILLFSLNVQAYNEIWRLAPGPEEVSYRNFELFAVAPNSVDGDIYRYMGKVIDAEVSEGYVKLITKEGYGCELRTESVNKRLFYDHQRQTLRALRSTHALMCYSSGRDLNAGEFYTSKAHSPLELSFYQLKDLKHLIGR